MISPRRLFASCAAAVILAALCGEVKAESVQVQPGASGQAAPARMDFAIRMPEILHLDVLAQPAHLDVTADDIARGYVDSHSTVQILSNARQGFDVRVDVLDALIAGGEVLGLGQALQLMRDGSAARATHYGRADKRVTYQLRYRLQLAPDGTPGRYRWPLRIGVNG